MAALVLTIYAEIMWKLAWRRHAVVQKSLQGHAPTCGYCGNGAVYLGRGDEGALEPASRRK
jgi:aerobic-type carbon monoxide dehydrogenase small subunit (CoxS/CutS family)